MMLLALDLGTTTGFAVGAKCDSIGDGSSNVVTASGTWNLKPSRYDGGGMRFVKFRARLDEIRKAWPAIDAVYFEEVRRHVGTDAAHVYGGLMATLQTWCEENKVPYEGIPVGTIKKFATGKGNADKAAMLASAQSAGFNPTDDNEADAIALARLKLGEQA